MEERINAYIDKVYKMRSEFDALKDTLPEKMWHYSYTEECCGEIDSDLTDVLVTLVALQLEARSYSRDTAFSEIVDRLAWEDGKEAMSNCQ